MEAPIRIAHVIGKWIGGGVESVVMNYYRNINRGNIQFDFICDKDSTNIPYKEIEKLGGKVILIPPYQKLFSYHKELKKVLIEGNYKIVHSHINTLSIFPLYAAKRAKVPIRIAHSHSTTNKKEWKKNMLKQILRPFSKVFSTHYFACSEYAGRWLFGNKVYDAGEVFLLNNAIDLEKFKYNEKIRYKKRRELNINKDTIVIGHIGRFVKQKNHEFLIDIFNEVYKQNKNVCLLLIGQGPDQNIIKEKTKQLHLDKVVKFLGQRSDVDELYQAMDIFLFPSLYEGLGMVLIEAECSNLLCIASEEVPKIAKLTNNVEFIKLDESPKVWADVLLEKSKYNKRKDMSQEIRKGGYDIKKEAKKLEDKYKELVNGL